MKEDEVRQLIQDVHKNRKTLPLKDVVDQFIESLAKLIQANSFQARDCVIRVLNEETDEGKLIDPSKGDADINIWRWCWISFFNLKKFLDADKVIEECYLCLLRLQTKNNRRYHKGTPLQTKAEGLIRVGFPTKAKRFVILAHIEDLIRSQTTGQTNAPAEMTLKHAGISDKDLKLIADETRKAIDEKKVKGEDLLYPEEVYQKIQFQIDFANVGEMNKNLVFTNTEYLKELLKRVNDASEQKSNKDNKIKRETLEELAQYLFSSVEGLYVQPSKRTSTYELDNIITNSTNHSFLRTLDTYIPIECKNWKKPIGAPEITQFIAKLSLYKCNLGIILSRQGIKKKTVNELRKDAYRRLGIYVLIFDENDIKGIIEGEDLISLMIDKYKELKFS
jgi:hypothetical protein